LGAAIFFTVNNTTEQPQAPALTAGQSKVTPEMIEAHARFLRYGGRSTLAAFIANHEAAKLRELKRLAKVLTYKADIYGPNGRIYGFEAKFAVRDGKLFHGTVELDPSTLTDGHGRTITSDSNF
jgi:hypothetical protein